MRSTVLDFALLVGTCASLQMGAVRPVRLRAMSAATVEAELEECVAESVSWIVAHGGLYALPAVDMAALGETYAAAAGVAFCHAPFALAPFPWPRSEFERCVELQPLLGALVEAVAHDGEWLEKTLAETVLSDDFTARVFAVHSANPSPQTVSLGLLRSDYMLDWSCAEKDAAAPLSVGRSLQVELNTIASSFACLSATVSELHAFSHSKKQHASSHKADDKDAPSSLPANGAATGLARGIAAAHLEYERQLHCSSSAPVGGGGGPNALPRRCVMVVQPGERNQMDQRMLEHELWSSHGVALERVTLKQLHDEAVLDHETGALSLKGKFEVSVAYLRAGYSPEDYSSEEEWSARAVLERSRCVKCPTAAYQLAGTKKVQQALAQPGALERFVSQHDAEKLRAVFAGLYDLDVGNTAQTESAVLAALAAPHRFVLKPQREGGGNNLYGAELVAALTEMSPVQRSAFVLMDKITSPSRPATLVRNGRAIHGECVAELGIYGAVLVDSADGRVLLNDVCGHLLRQKLVGVDEGGVAAGFAVLSSPQLV